MFTVLRSPVSKGCVLSAQSPTLQIEKLLKASRNGFTESCQVRTLHLVLRSGILTHFMIAYHTSIRSGQRSSSSAARTTLGPGPEQPLEPLAPVGDRAARKIRVAGSNPNTPYTRSSALTSRSKYLYQSRDKLRLAPVRQHHGQPATHFVLRRRFLGRQLHLYQTADRRSRSPPPLPALLLEMPIIRDRLIQQVSFFLFFLFACELLKFFADFLSTSSTCASFTASFRMLTFLEDCQFF